MRDVQTLFRMPLVMETGPNVWEKEWCWGVKPNHSSLASTRVSAPSNIRIGKPV
jgi:hypothetical protein